jgi:hypothetical protein
VQGGTLMERRLLLLLALAILFVIIIEARHIDKAFFHPI